MKKTRAAIAVAVVTALLAACGTRAPAPRLYQLHADPPPSPAVTRAPPPRAEVWELSPQIALPAYVDRETMVVADGGARLVLLDGARWAEPLRDTLPRLLHHDLVVLRGASSVWLAPAPLGAAPARRLRIEIVALHAGRAPAAVRLQARWWFEGGTDRATPAVAHEALFDVPLAGSGDEGAAIAAAHRAALWRLAGCIAADASGAQAAGSACRPSVQ